ncbi:septum formation initiator family protein [Candidatus Uhrbacteria bacterium]|nr:septum formation initiator family protein [Candidatus Uhrbacteria bacterium]
MPILKKIFSSWIAASVLALIFLIFTYRAVLLAQKSYQTDSDISELHADLEETTKKRQQLESMRDLLASDFFAENEARTKFGLRKAGEIVAVVPNAEVVPTLADNGSSESHANFSIPYPQSEDTREDQPAMIHARWWDYFFGVSSRQSRPRDLNP